MHVIRINGLLGKDKLQQVNISGNGCEKNHSKDGKIVQYFTLPYEGSEVSPRETMGVEWRSESMLHHGLTPN